jgi:Uma2 family endonuclease
MGLAERSNDAVYTYGDYLEWPENERWEIFNGAAFNMAAAPTRKHQKILGELYRQISNFLVHKTCDVYSAPFDVRFPEADEKEDEIKTVLQPDISIICDQTKLDEKGCLGSPDLIIEIVSPFTLQRDMGEKFFIYEKSGVKEYWIVHPVDRTVMVFKLQPDNKYGRPEIYFSKGIVDVGILPGLTIDLSAAFSD